MQRATSGYFEQINRIDRVFTVHHFSKQPNALSLNKPFPNGATLKYIQRIFFYKCINTFFLQTRDKELYTIYTPK